MNRINQINQLDFPGLFMPPRIKIFYEASHGGFGDKGIQDAVNEWMAEEPRYITHPPSIAVANEGRSVVMTILWLSQADMDKLSDLCQKALES